jgi:hypothetical protein
MLKNTILKCDNCGNNANWLYILPCLCVVGQEIVADKLMNPRKFCKECTEKLLDIYNHYKEV